ncbi:MAG: mandelate racemase/muconate lactonizing enzyme family protein [Halobacteriales archaeon]
MEITDVSVVQLEHELPAPHGLSRDRTIGSRGVAAVVIDTDSGLRGIGEAVGPDPYIAETIVEKKYAPRLRGEDPLERERLWRSMLVEDVYWDQKGQGVAAGSGVDMALWDLAGKHYDEPVSALLGGATTADRRITAYASDLFWDDPETMAKTAAEYVDRGFEAVKTHLGRGLEADERRVAAMTEAIGDADLMVDMNCGYGYADALRVGRMLEEYDVYWYEEPLSPYDIDGLAELRAALSVPIATGENEYTKWGFKDLFLADAVDYAMPDLMRCGGITEGAKIAGLAEAFDVTVTPHCFASGIGVAATLQFMLATPACAWLELDVTDFPLLEGLLKEPLDIEAGRVAVPEGPGLGVELTDEIIAKYGVDPT